MNRGLWGWLPGSNTFHPDYDDFYSSAHDSDPSHETTEHQTEPLQPPQRLPFILAFILASSLRLSTSRAILSRFLALNSINHGLSCS
jgi:hypothetical protein